MTVEVHKWGTTLTAFADAVWGPSLLCWCIHTLAEQHWNVFDSDLGFWRMEMNIKAQRVCEGIKHKLKYLPEMVKAG